MEGGKHATRSASGAVHDGALPARNHKALRDLLSDEQKLVIRLSAILRLANALDVTHDGHVRSVKLANVESPKQRSNGFRPRPAGLGENEALVIAAEGYPRNGDSDGGCGRTVFVGDGFEAPHSGEDSCGGEGPSCAALR